MVCHECDGTGTVEVHDLYASCASSMYITDKIYDDICEVCHGKGELNDDEDTDFE